jgi:SAM-dependent methyltransferase
MTESWDTIADWYAERLRRGSAMHEFARDILLAALPVGLDGVRVIDLGCGEGILTRAVALRGATVVGIDPTVGLIAHARRAEETSRTGAVYAVDDGCSLSTVANESVDWVIAGLALNNVPDLEAAVRSVWRGPASWQSAPDSVSLSHGVDRPQVHVGPGGGAERKPADRRRAAASRGTSAFPSRAGPPRLTATHG